LPREQEINAATCISCGRQSGECTCERHPWYDQFAGELVGLAANSGAFVPLPPHQLVRTAATGEVRAARDVPAAGLARAGLAVNWGRGDGEEALDAPSVSDLVVEARRKELAENTAGVNAREQPQRR
jgi:hypothetical protein